ncbi:SpoIVB peptidase [Alkalicoccobacillus murimartini]|uniref:Stage IV sporulation protein B n=1 Tax=Alkalicoccobacillus murimartini TaxID=171685 RepID=A0ABT9YM68_9BACI|nr:SpoIVB peptidase [Alkalicoccobacillus murimartini]MDQ0208952.1 stage IV sporulation protein B [Alkalicoccobacillus murimartini]
MKVEGARIIVGVLLLAGMLIIGFSNPLKEWANIPTSITVFKGEEVTLQHSKRLTAELGDHTKSVLKNNTSEAMQAVAQGHGDVTLKAAGFPVKAVSVNILPERKVIAGGQSIGVKLNTKGVLVVGHHLIKTNSGETSPGESAGIEVGDMITKINGVPIEKMSEVSKVVQQAGEEEQQLKIELKRNQQPLVKTLHPMKPSGEQSYRMGLFIRDSAAGVGTMTFYDPATKKFGALGHVISDSDTHKPIMVHDGEVLRSSVSSIEKGLHGDPGEKLASFSKDREILGSINKNSSFGIFGTLNKADLKNEVMDEELPIALSNQIKEGPAKILTVVSGEKVEEFDIEIVNALPQKQPATKGLVLKVTDPKLLETTGGIVQGMSGSPIIQDGKLVGAVTHVFVNDPTSGYGCHISWMLEEAGVMPNTHQAKAS